MCLVVIKIRFQVKERGSVGDVDSGKCTSVVEVALDLL
jgi:hypothetical protein